MQDDMGSARRRKIREKSLRHRTMTEQMNETRRTDSRPRARMWRALRFVWRYRRYKLHHP